MLPQRMARQPCCERFSCNSTTAACRSLCQLSCFSLTNFYDRWPPSRRVRPALRPPASMKARKTRAKRPVSVVCSIIIEVHRQTLSQRLAGGIWPCALREHMPCRVTVRIWFLDPFSLSRLCRFWVIAMCFSHTCLWAEGFAFSAWGAEATSG